VAQGILCIFMLFCGFADVVGDPTHVDASGVVALVFLELP
jgi:hypothetical protein